MRSEKRKESAADILGFGQPDPSLIQMVMLATASLIIFFCCVPPHKFATGSVFRSGLVGVVGAFGIA